MWISRISVLVLLYSFLSCSLYPQEISSSDYAEIFTLTRDDVNYIKQQISLEKYYQWQSRGGDMPQVDFYLYQTSYDEDLYSLSAAFGVSVEALATINDISNINLFIPGSQLIVPNMPGMFSTAHTGETPGTATQKVTLIRGEEADELLFIPGKRFSSDQRKEFMGPLFAYPLDEWYITSEFGYRTNPLTANVNYHKGIDLRAPEGTKVFAPGSGIVTAVTTDSVFGLNLLIDHENGYETYYAHLNDVLVSKGDTIVLGQFIAKSGNSGATTGPHLHFEIRKDGEEKNPELYLP